MFQNFLQTGLYYPKASIGVKRKKKPLRSVIGFLAGFFLC
ncbi:hypothetical protein RB2083_1566 [Rhodobacteraceae bacterium HTCC2083]|jgi:hypothetical protein|nr:hypothetical protein RB2083_1566 [Rhodobacteraceae bacterium HTCC2083]